MMDDMVVLFQAVVISNARRSSLLEGEVLVVPEGDMLIPVNTPQLAYNALSQENNIWNGAVINEPEQSLRFFRFFTDFRFAGDGH